LALYAVYGTYPESTPREATTYPWPSFLREVAPGSKAGVIIGLTEGNQCLYGLEGISLK